MLVPSALLEPVGGQHRAQRRGGFVHSLQTFGVVVGVRLPGESFPLPSSSRLLFVSHARRSAESPPPPLRTARASELLESSSFVADVVASDRDLTSTTPQVVDFAINLGSPEFFAIILVAFVGTAAILGSSRVRGFAALLIGLAIGLVGTDFVTGQQRPG